MEPKLKNKRPGAPMEASGKPDKAPGKSTIARTWLVVQGDTISEVVSDDAPDVKVQPGERRKRILGSATTAEKLAKLKSRWMPLARGVLAQGGVR